MDNVPVLNLNAIYTTQDLKKLLRVGDGSITVAVNSGDLKCSRFRMGYRFLGTDILEFLRTKSRQHQLTNHTSPLIA